MQRSHTARARLSLHATVMLMFMCMMQAKRGTAHRESMYDLQHQGQEEDATSCEPCGYKNSTDGCPNDQPSRGVWGSAQAAGNSAASQPECREGSDARTDVRRARYIP